MAFVWLRTEFRAARPVFLFFLIGFLLILLIVKLALARYSIEVGTLSRALVGALVAAKVTLLLDETPLAHSLKRYPRIFGITLQTMVYGLAVILLGIVEKTVEAYRHLGTFGAAWQDVGHRMEIHQLLAIALGTSLIFAAYFVLSEVSRNMGEGALWAMLFEFPAEAGGCHRGGRGID
ncbi:MAG: hypothetical protein ACREQN_11470 [Candidatus Binataceae bacterium]